MPSNEEHATNLHDDGPWIKAFFKINPFIYLFF